VIFPTDVPMFVLEMISVDESADRGMSESFNVILDELKRNDFHVDSGFRIVREITKDNIKEKE
jgi:hypothetical protein